MEQFISEWWPAIAALLLGVAKLLNTISAHWTKQGGWVKKVAGFIIEVLDLVRVPELKDKRDGK